MPFVFGVLGVLFLVAGVRGKSTDLFALIKSDFSGQPNYFEWMIAIFLVGAIGYIKELGTVSRMFMFLVLAGLLYKNKQVFAELNPEETTQPTTTQQPMQGTGTNGLPALPNLPNALPNLLNLFQ
jgi:hypothetical protein